MGESGAFFQGGAPGGPVPARSGFQRLDASEEQRPENFEGNSEGWRMELGELREYAVTVAAGLRGALDDKRRRRLGRATDELKRLAEEE